MESRIIGYVSADRIFGYGIKFGNIYEICKDCCLGIVCIERNFIGQICGRCGICTHASAKDIQKFIRGDNIPLAVTVI